jgi:hypothetical protein
MPSERAVSTPSGRPPAGAADASRREREPAVRRGLAFVRERPDAGNLYFVQTRLQVDSY